MTTNTPYDPVAEVTLLRSQGYVITQGENENFNVDGKFILYPKQMLISKVGTFQTWTWKPRSLKAKLDVLTGKIKAEAPLHNLVYVVGKTTTVEASRVSYAIAKQKQKDLKQTGNYNLGKLKIERA